MTRRANKSSIGGRVLGLVFIVIGFLAAAMTGGSQIAGYLSTSHWVEVPANIQNLRLDRHSGSESTTYSVNSRYTYRYNGKSYNGNRVGFSSSSDNIGTYWQDLYSELNLLRRSNEATAFINPDDPFQSILDRTLRWQLLVFGSMFVLMFGGGGAMLLFGWSPNSNDQRQQDGIARNQNAGEIQSEDKQSAVYLFGFGCVFFLVGAGFGAIILPTELAKGNYAALLILLFAIMGVGIIFAAVKRYLAFNKFGYAPLTIAPPMAAVGGKLDGSFKIQTEGLNVVRHQSFTAQLVCTETSRSGKKVRRKAIWQADTPVSVKALATGLGCRFDFDIPENCIPTQPYSGGSSIDWAVTVEARFDDKRYKIFKRSWPLVISDCDSVLSKAA